MSKQILYIITGLPFSGKTTLISELIKRKNVVLASVDEFISKRKYVIEDMTQDDWDTVYSLAYSKLEKLLKKGKTVVFDGGSLLKSERDCLKGIAKKLGVRNKLIYVKTEISEIKKRVEQNRKSKNRDDVIDSTLEKAIAMFEEPSNEEAAIVYNYFENLEDWLDKNLS